MLYFLFMIVATFGEFFAPTFMVPGDATATSRNIISAEPAYRLGILTGFVTLLFFIFLVERLYKLFRQADRGQALLMVTSMVLPEYWQIVSRVMMPLYFCEVPIIFWLLIKGANVPNQQAPT